jgi:hypothetical protein
MCTRASAVLAFSLFVAACGGDDTTETADAVPLPPDASTTPDVNVACQEPTSVLPYEFRPLDLTSTGVVTTMQNGTTTAASIDATAGGSAGYAEYPFIYVDLATGTKVDISDVDSYSSTAWDIAFKRFLPRINGGDSGPGGVEVAVVFGVTSLDQVTTSPAANEFGTDDWATTDCELVAGPIGEPNTAMSTWYMYEGMTLAPQPWVYVLRLRDGTFRKFRFVNYYGGPTMTSGYLDVEWAPL